MPKTLPPGLTPFLALALLGCTGGPTPTEPVPPAAATARLTDGRTTAVLATYTLTLDPQALTATARLDPARGTQANDDLYLLSIGRFLRPNTFAVDRIRLTAATVDLDYTVTHPFPAPPDPAGAPTALNRADLGFAGLVLFTVDVPSAAGNTYFDEGAGGRVIANTALITNADGYYQPAGLLNLPRTANTFPFERVVDESGPGNRVGISNGGDPTGNYGADGWLLGEMGTEPPFNKWTGYGVLHHGQAATNTVSLSRAALGAGPAQITVAIVARYNDPRAGVTILEKRANRLPPATPDPLTRMAYRMPHGALDLEQVTVKGITEGEFVTNEASSVTLAYDVVDWDANAAETSLPDLSQDPVVTNVAQGESGPPSVAVSIPGVLGGPEVIHPLFYDATGTGRPDDPLRLSSVISKEAVGGQTPGTYTGMLRMVDREDQVPQAVAIDEQTLAPLTANLPRPITYQAFPVPLADVSPPTGGLIATWGGSADSQTQVTGCALDAAGNIYVAGAFRETVDFDPGEGVAERTSNAGNDAYCLALTPTGEFRWVATWGGASLDQAAAVAVGPDGPVLCGSFLETVDFDPGAGVVERTAAGTGPGTQDAFLLALGGAGEFRWVGTWGAEAFDMALGVALDPTGGPRAVGGFSGTVDFDPGNGSQPRTAAGESGADAFCSAFTASGEFQWVAAWGGEDSDLAYNVAVDPLGAPRICGTIIGTVDFDPGPGEQRRSGGAFVLGLSDIGRFQFASAWGPANEVVPYSIALDSLGGPVLCGYFLGTVDFDPGITVENRTSNGLHDAFAMGLDNDGILTWITVWGGPDPDWAYSVELTAANAPRLAGSFQGTVDFDAGPGVQARASAGILDAYALALSAAGDFRWVTPWGGTGSEVATGLALTPDGSLRVGGTFSGTVDFDPTAGVAERTPAGQPDAYLLGLTPEGGW